MIVVALHGFFGTPDDWRAALRPLENEIDLVTPDLAVWATRGGVTDFETFASQFNRSVRLLVEESGDQVLITGYSLGARLAAHCLLDEPDLYQAGVFISMNPGITGGDFQSRRDRVAFDLAWSERMRREPWEKTWKAWNEQEVLKPGSLFEKAKEPRLMAASSDFAEKIAEAESRDRKLSGRREAWARAMDIWTLGLQADLRRDLLEWTLEDESRSIVLMTGADDKKFSEITETWMQSALASGVSPESLRHVLVKGAGHRLITELPEAIASEISKLL